MEMYHARQMNKNQILEDAAADPYIYGPKGLLAYEVRSLYLTHGLS
jgi:hypothetical protein